LTLTDLFDLSLVGRRDCEALEFQGHTYTFGDIESRSNRMANLLLAKGFRTGDRLCVQMANCIAMIDLFLACVKTGVIFVPVNILYKGRETEHIEKDAAPRVFLREPGEIAAWIEEAERQPDSRPSVIPALDGASPAGIIYTSGTTGTSKGAVLTHNNFAVNALNIVTCWQITSADRLLLALPLFHVHALGNGIHAWLVSGCRMRLLERFEHQKAAAEFLEFAPTLFFGVPTMYVRLLDFPEETARTIGERMRLFVCGSAPLPAQTLEDFRVRYGGHTILERYGMSETLMNTGNPYVGERRPGSVGLPFPGVTIEVRDSEGTRVADTVEGELYLKGGNLFAGYWGRDEATRAAFSPDGFFRTGDMGFRSLDGYYTLCGRKSDLIISGGFNIYPREIEEFLQEQPGVLEAAVIGEADRVRGEVPVAFFAGEADPAVLEEACRAELASFKVPRRFERVEKLPRNAMGKLAKTLLRNPSPPGASKV
jgi:malonyl-CoA/methylmalonyl-CoA synthetase